MGIEAWKDIKGYEGLYQVSSFGAIRSLDRLDNIGRKIAGKVIKPFIDTDGYANVGLYKNGESLKYKAHRLVAQNFIPNPDNKPEVNHIDENKQNNMVSNLEWCTRRENENHGTKRERCKKNTDYSMIGKKNSKSVIQCDLNGSLIKEWSSITEIHRALGYSKGNISSCCNGKLQMIYGCVWKFKEVS